MPRTGGIASINGSNCNSRLTQVTYPSGRKLDYVYDSGLDATISRVTAIADDVSGTPSTRLEAYLYLGVDTIVQRTHAQSGVNLTYIKQGADPKAIADAGDPYTGLDRFGRVIDQNWFKTSTSTSTDRYQYGYDRAGQRLYKANLVDSALSELYHANSATSGDDNTAYDPLGRLTAFRRGTLSASANNGGKLDTIATTSKSQSWSLDALGNWSGQTTDSTTTTRNFNAQNQTTAASGGGATTPTYNAAGNTITSNGLTFVYDAWNRLTYVKSGSTVLASYRYDALSRRITETTGSTTDQLYYSADWQVLEERRGGTGSSFLSQQYVWGLGYVDDLVLRDSYTSGALSQRLYVQQDAQFSVTALTDTSGAVVERYLYDPYGTATITDASYAARAGNASLYAWKYLHQGGRLDATTSWYSFRNRDYIASEGRWAERDPLGLAAGDMNVYRYVGNGPTYAVDPSGLAPPVSGGYWGGGWNPANWNRWLYTGNPNAPDEYYDAALNGPNGAGASVQANSGRAKTAFDTISVVDPTPISDTLSAGVSYAQGNDAEARRELALAIIPGAVGQLGKFGKLGKKAEDLAGAAKNGPGLRRGADFIETGRRGGELYDQAKIEKMRNYLKRRGVELKVGDEFVPKGKAGGFAIDGSELVLKSNPTKYEVWHELAHYRQFSKIGPENYKNLPRTLNYNAPEQYVFDMLENSPRRWNALTHEEQQHAIDYIERIGGFR